MTADDVKLLVEAGMAGADVAVEGSGDKYQIRVVSEAFTGLRPVRRQQLVYGCIQAQLAEGSIHAVEIKPFTPEEWDKATRMGLI